MRIHLALSMEPPSDGSCPKCGAATVLVTVAGWMTHPEGDGDQDEVEVADEVSGHMCPGCKKLTGLFFNEGVADCCERVCLCRRQGNHDCDTPGGENT